MAGSPKLKVHNPQGEYVASCKRFEDAAMLAGAYGPGAKIKHRDVSGFIWHEGSEDFSAADSFDGAADIMQERITTRTRAALVDTYGENTIAEWETNKQVAA